MESLSDDGAGTFLVCTMTGSRYLLDLDQRVFRRTPRDAWDETLRLRRDGDVIDLVELVRCVRGEPMLLLIDLDVPGVSMTSRETTAVVSIEATTSGLVR